MIQLKEDFVNIPGFDGNYKISISGLIFSIKRQGSGGCYLSPVITKLGYKRVLLMYKKRQHHKFLHVLLATVFIPNPQKLKFINHIDGNKLNNSIDNLEWCTSSHNAKHAYDIGLRRAHPVIGENNYGSKLTEIKVKDIISSHLSQKKLSVKYGVSAGVIQRIKQRKSWKHIN